MSAQPPGSTTTTDFHLERYRYILQQLHATNENVYRFLAIYQSLATAIAGAALALFVGYRKWGIEPGTARAGVVGLMCLVTLVAVFTILLVVIGVLTWLDYRTEECELTDEAVAPGFRSPPNRRNLVRWHETYIVAFVVVSLIAMWVLATAFLLPAID
jgi:hypothetical protein